MKEVVRRPKVYEDLAEISLRIAADDPQAALRFLDAAESTVRQLALSPALGRPRRFQGEHLKDLRSWRINGFAKYLVFYREHAEGLEIIRILHGARDLPQVLGEPRRDC